MNEVIVILKMGYFEAIKDSSKNKYLKKHKILLNNEIKSILYDIGYKLGINDYIKYYKNTI